MSRARLHELLQAAVELELAVIPPYLCALYSLHPQGNDRPKLIIRSVVVEEMLHLILAANVLNAIGGHPRVAGEAHCPRYPHELPDGVILDLLPFSPAAIELFLKVENPQYDHRMTLAAAQRRHAPHVSRVAALTPQPKTVGAFYAEIIEELERTAHEIGERELFCGERSRQVTGAYYYAGGGRPTVVHDLKSARAALNEIVEQGEGDMHSMYDDDGDLAHYFRFEEIKYDRAYLPSDDAGRPSGPPIGVDFARVYPMLVNPRGSDYADPELRAASDATNRTWSTLLSEIDAALAGEPQRLLGAVPRMLELRDQAQVLLANPVSADSEQHAGPTFEWTAPGPADRQHRHETVEEPV
jgi:Ferritin-like